MLRGVISLSKEEIEEIRRTLGEGNPLLSRINIEDGKETYDLQLSAEELESILDSIDDMELRNRLSEILRDWRS